MGSCARETQARSVRRRDLSLVVDGVVRAGELQGVQLDVQGDVVGDEDPVAGGRLDPASVCVGIGYAHTEEGRPRLGG